MRECILPGKCIKWLILCRTFTVPILEILYIITCPMPANILLLGFSNRVHNNLHATPVQATMFIQIKNIEPYFGTFPGIGDLKEEPLRVTVGVNIVLEE